MSSSVPGYWAQRNAHLECDRKVTPRDGSVEPLPDRPGPRAQFERSRDEFLPRDLMLLHAAARYQCNGQKPPLDPGSAPFYRLPRDRRVPICLTPVIGRIRSLFK
jgi:hypothetical protein